MTKTIDKPAAAPAKELYHGPVNMTRIEVVSNVRKRFDEKKLTELADNIRKAGVLEPILLRPNGKPDHYYLVAGERRLRAAKEAGLTEIPARVLDLDEETAAEVQIIENLDREDLHPLDEAAGYKQLLRVKGYDAARIAERVGRSVHYVYDRLKLVNLISPLQEQFLAGNFSTQHAIILSRLSREDQARAAKPGRDGGLYEFERGLWDPRDEGALDEPEPVKARSVRELQAWVDEHVRFEQRQAEPFLFPDAAAAFEARDKKVEKVVEITLEHYVQRDARNGAKIIGPRSWERADGKHKSKECEYSIIGVIVAGPGRGESFRVCTQKEKCKTHWGAWQKERAAARKQASRGRDGDVEEDMEKQKREALAQAKREAVRDAVDAALAAAVVEAVRGNVRFSDDDWRTLAGIAAEDVDRDVLLALGIKTHVWNWQPKKDFPAADAMLLVFLAARLGGSLDRKALKMLGVDVETITNSATAKAAEVFDAENPAKKPAKK